VTEKRTIATLLIVASALLFASDALFDFARYTHGTLLADPHTYVSVGASKAWVFRSGGVIDMLGSYLLPIPAIVYLWRRLRSNDNLYFDIAALAGVSFGLAGAASAAVLSMAGAPLITAYAHATPGARPAIALVFATVSDATTNGIWQTLDSILLATWLIGLAITVRTRWPWFARYSIALGVMGLVAALGLMFGSSYSGSVPQALIFLPLNVWFVWLAVRIMRDVSAP